MSVVVPHSGTGLEHHVDSSLLKHRPNEVTSLSDTISCRTFVDILIGRSQQLVFFRTVHPAEGGSTLAGMQDGQISVLAS